ncbi:MAG: DUF2130 domain-containing protein [Nitrosarchaeum sp.]
MEENISDVKNTKCPLCHKILATKEYRQAVQDLENKIQQNFDKEDKKRSEEFETHLKELKEQYEKDKKNYQINHEEEIKKLQKDLEKSHETQLTILEKNYEKMSIQNQKQFTILEKQLQINHKKELQGKNKQLETLEKQLKNSHRKELTDKTNQIMQLKRDQENFKKTAIANAKASFDVKSRQTNEELLEKEIQLKRFSEEVESLKKQLSQSQSELKGEAGELDLYSTLTHAFSTDFFRRQKRGTSSGDLIQQIRITTGSLDTPIVYDNKSASTVSKNDIEKAKKYKKIHGTNYVVIVSNNLPKKMVPNGLYGEKEGVLLAHPSIIIEVTRQIRSGIIEISKLSKSKEDQKAKQFKLYEYIISPEFTMILETLSEINEKLFNLQNKEERDHQTLWKNRKDLHEQLVKTYNEISSGIESITQKDVFVEEHLTN